MRWPGERLYDRRPFGRSRAQVSLFRLVEIFPRNDARLTFVQETDQSLKNLLRA